FNDNSNNINNWHPHCRASPWRGRNPLTINPLRVLTTTQTTQTTGIRNQVNMIADAQMVQMNLLLLFYGTTVLSVG
ncbi:MAG: hypothetical protein J6S96_07705, partial [Muribaculaceae bacterium]|nr:hypothetical protein [Muribaculaceae bacterium]